MTRRTVGAIAGGVVALVAILAFLRRSKTEDSAPAPAVPPVVRSEAPRATTPAPLPAPPPTTPAEPVAETPPAPVPDADVLVGRVMSSTWTPVAGAEVTTLAERVVRGETGADEHDSEERTVVTGVDGRFRVAPLRRDLRHALRIRAAGHGHVALDFDPRAEGPGVIDIGDQPLPLARSVHGLARETSGRPLAKATVRLRAHRDDRNPAVRRDSFLEWRETTDDDGRFRFREIASGNYTARLEAEGWEAVEVPVFVHPEHDSHGIELLVESGRRLVLVFVDEYGAPVEKQVVICRGPGAVRELPAQWSDAKGRVEIRGLPGREMRFTTQVGLLPGEKPRFAPEEIGPLVPNGQEIRVVLHPLSFVRGRVVDGEDRPLHGIQIDPWEGDRWLYSLTTNSGRDGQFEIAVAAGRTLDLRVEGHSSRSDGRNVHSTTTRWRGSLGPVESPAEGLVLRCRKPPADRTLRVRVTDADGAPVKGAVLVWPDEGEFRTAETGADGVARCEGMLATRVRVSYRIPPSVPLPEGQLAPEGVEVVPEGQLVEMPHRRGSSFTVFVKNSSGVPLPGVDVEVGGPSREYWPWRGVTDLAGSCKFTVEKGLELDKVTVTSRGAKGTPTSATRHRVPTDSGELVIVLDSSR